ncbi:MAG: TolC family protein [Armatimonadota bacterium]|nr:TolC family protein [Armatimonadota bacterium]
MRHLFCWVAMAFLCGVSFTAAVAAEELPLDDAIRLAIDNNPTIAAGLFSAEAAKQAARGAKALTNPEISVAPSMIGDAGSGDAMIFSQPLEINGSRKVRGQIAAREANAAGFDAMATRRDLVVRVKEVYWEVAWSQELVKLNQDNVEYLETLRKAVQKQLDVGAAPGSQLLKTEVELAIAKQYLIQAQLEQSQAKATLNALLNRPKDQEITATDPLVSSTMALDRAALQAAAQSQRPEIAAAQAQVAAAQGQIRSARLRRVPDLALQARRDTFLAGSVGGVALQVVLPVLDWGSVKAERRSAEATFRSQQKQLEATRNNVALDVEQAVQSVAASAEIVGEYQGGILEKSEELAQMARTGYEKGATGYLEVLEAQRTLRNAKTAYYSALANHAKSIAQLEWASGAANVGKTEVKK